ncbi:MAG: ribonuclease HII [Candidatus Thorarchaeota archaeon]|jgi:ribonuclease HII
MTRKNRLHGIAGVDEAGRGPMIGPLVICGVLVNSERIPELERLGAKDSKTLSPSRRRSLNQRIRSIATQIEIRSVSAAAIDRLRKRTTLNEIEVTEFAAVVKSLKPQEAYLDAADVNAERFGNKIGELSGLARLGAVIVSEHKADSKYPIVSAASILAKVERDRIIDEMHQEYGDFGSGYPSDPKTIRFVRGLYEDGLALPSIVRKSWDSVRKIRESTEQSTLDSF